MLLQQLLRAALLLTVVVRQVCVCVCVRARVRVCTALLTLTSYLGLQTALLTALVLGLAFRTGIWVCDWAIRIGDAKEWWIPEAAERLGTCPFFSFFFF